MKQYMPLKPVKRGFKLWVLACVGELLHGFALQFQLYTGAAEGSEKGLGLGLYIVEQVVQTHGGTVCVADEVAGRTTFAVELPRTATLRPGKALPLAPTAS